MNNKPEIEVKLACDDLEPFRRAGLALEVHKSRHFEDNWLLDTEADSLLKQGAALRIRFVGKQGWGTYKRIALESASSSLKVREEIESEVADPGRLVALFERLGYKRSFRYQKYRTAYILSDGGHRVEVAFDETRMGNFCKIEGEEAGVLEVLGLAGFSVDSSIRKSYPELQEKRCRDKGLPVEDLVFR